jgi:hypothetical protein
VPAQLLSHEAGSRDGAELGYVAGYNPPKCYIITACHMEDGFRQGGSFVIKSAYRIAGPSLALAPAARLAAAMMARAEGMRPTHRKQ